MPDQGLQQWCTRKKLKSILIVGVLLIVAVCMSYLVAFDSSYRASGLTLKSADLQEERGVKGRELRYVKENDGAGSMTGSFGNIDPEMRSSTSTLRDDEVIELKSESETAYLNKVFDWTSRFKDDVVLTGKLNWNNSLKGKPVDCSSWSDSDTCYEWPNETRFTVSLNRSEAQDMNCFDLEWTALRCVDQVFTDCYDLEATHWYGGFQNRQQYWPLSRNTISMTAFISHDIFLDPIGDVLERYFFSSKGTGIYIDDEVPFYLSMNRPKGLMCFSAKYENVGYNNFDHKYPILKYKICQSDNVKNIHSKMAAMFLTKPTGIPDVKLFQFPIWSTWAEFRNDIKQSDVIKFAREILANNFSHAQLEIDDNWTPAYGDYEFDVKKFPSAADTIGMLKSMGFRVTVWVHPFFNIDSKSFLEGASLEYFIREYNSTRPALIEW